MTYKFNIKGNFVSLKKLAFNKLCMTIKAQLYNV